MTVVTTPVAALTKFVKRARPVALMTLCLLPAVAPAEFEYRGNVSVQGQVFTEDPIHTGDKDANLSTAFEIELYRSFADDTKSLIFTPFVRAHLDGDDSSHIDIRELLFVQSSDEWEFSLGLGQVFWGVAESRNIVDVINQTDNLEGLLTNAKLGQPMINLTSVRDWGNLSFYVLPGFREFEFADEDSRPRLPFLINESNPVYESDDEQSHVDFALRYSHFINEWDFGLSWFNGTARTPQLTLDPSALASDPNPALVPAYYLVNHIGADVQATLENWLLKLELIRQSGKRIENHFATVTGFEYSFYGLGESSTDLGVVVEYLWDERGSDAGHPFQNDLLVGLRFALNDEQSSEALLGLVSDLDERDQVFTLEANRRIGDSFKIAAEAAIWEAGNRVNQPFRQEDYLQLELSYFF